MRVQQTEAQPFNTSKRSNWLLSSSTLIMMKIQMYHHMNRILVWEGPLFNKRPDKIDKKILRKKSRSLELEGNQMFWTIALMEAIFLQLLKTKKGWLLFALKNQTRKRIEREVLPTEQAVLSNQTNSALLLRQQSRKES